MALLQVDSVSKSFGANPVLKDISFHADAGEIVSLLGPSGCGKTTVLRIVAGLETADAGRVLFDGRSLAGVPVHQRGFGLMFQDFALFPHKDVAANVAFGLRMQKVPPGEVRARVSEMLDLVGLAGYGDRRVYELSGGEQQRVALARSLAHRPRLLMLDEPLGSLDRALREELMNELRAILKRVSVTALYVTHDQQEAFAIADRAMIMRQGRIVQQGTPQQVYRRPASAWVARFLGLANLIPGRVVAVDGDRALVDSPLGRLVAAEEGPLAAGTEATVLIRPEAARLAADCPVEQGTALRMAVKERSFRGSHYRLAVHNTAAPGGELVFDLVPGAGDVPPEGAPIDLVLRPEGISLLPPGEAYHG